MASATEESTNQQDEMDQQIIIRPLSEFPDLSTFNRQERRPALDIPVKRTADVRKQLKQVLWKRPKRKNVYNHQTDPSRRILILEDDSAFANERIQKLLQEDCQRTSFEITFTYEDFTADEVLEKILPVDEIPSSFETVGKLAHVNLRDTQLPFKYWIGKVLLDKNPRVQTVVNKLGTIETVYRTFGMEVIAGYKGDNWSMVTVKEEGCQFRLDFTRVYWNSRLAGEHRRLVQVIRKHAVRESSKEIVVGDLMSGVGPFAVPLTYAGTSETNVTVHANDLNPDSYKHLLENIKANKCKKIHSYNMCGRAMVRKLQEEKVAVHHFLMNLPASAPEFLDAFRGYQSNGTTPRVHVHCFAPKLSETSDYRCAVDRCSQSLGYELKRLEHKVNVHVVRDVSPKKNMLCISFDLPEQVSQLEVINPSPAEEPDAKKPKLE